MVILSPWDRNSLDKWLKTKSVTVKCQCQITVVRGCFCQCGQTASHYNFGDITQSPTLAYVKEAGGRGSQQGGAIGNTLTGALAVLYSLKWTRDFKAEPRRATADFPSFKLHLLKYYMDDGNGVSSSLPPGSRLIDGRVKVVEEEIEGDNTIPADIRTSDIILEIANTISPFIDLTVDSPSRNISGWMPILDLQIRVKRGQIIYKFYKKSVSNKLTMMERSAMPTQIKRNSLVQEGIRRLRNTKRELLWSVKSEILSEYSFSLMLSGYSEKFRLDTIQAAVKGYERQCQEADSGGTPLHRPRSWDQSGRRKKKLLTKTS